jgi:hypothetical protein
LAVLVGVLFLVWYGRSKGGDVRGEERREDVRGEEGVGEGLLVGTGKGSRTKTTMAKTTMAGTCANEE